MPTEQPTVIVEPLRGLDEVISNIEAREVEAEAEAEVEIEPENDYVSPKYLPTAFTPKMEAIYLSILLEHGLEDGAGSRRLVWKYLYNRKGLFPLNLMGLPPECDGLGVEQGKIYMLQNFPYPLLEYIFPALINLAFAFEQQKDYEQSEITFHIAGSTIVMGKRRKFMSYLFVVPGLQFLVQHYAAFKSFFDILRKHAFFVKHIGGGNIAILALLYGAQIIEAPEGVRVLSISKPNDILSTFKHDAHVAHGEYDRSLLQEELDMAVWRDYALTHGVLSQEDLSKQMNSPLQFQRLKIMHEQWKFVKGSTDKIRKEAVAYAKHMASSADKPTILDEANLRANDAKRRSGRKPGSRVTNFVLAEFKVVARGS